MTPNEETKGEYFGPPNRLGRRIMAAMLRKKKRGPRHTKAKKRK